MTAASSLHFSFYGLVAAYLACFICIDRLSSDTTAPFLLSEWLCWIFLFGFTKSTERTRHATPAGSHASDHLALAIAGVSMCWSMGDHRWVWPLLTPICVLIASRDNARPSLPTNAVEKASILGTYGLGEVKVPVKALAATTFIGTASAGILSHFHLTLWTTGLGIILVGCLTGLYFILDQSPHDEIAEDSVIPVTLPAKSTTQSVIAVLTMMCLVSTKATADINIPTLVFVGLIKAVRWVSVFELVNQGFLLPMSTLTTFATSAIEIAVSPRSSYRSEVVAGVAVLSLAQTYQFTHKLMHSRQIILALTCLLFMGLMLHHPPLLRDWRQTILGAPQPHPIEVLVKEAQADFANLVDSQSKTVPQARHNYELRYNRVPPPGFDEWVKLALEVKCPIIDSFDSMMENLEPFWGMTAQDFRVRSTITENGPMAITVVSNHTVSMPVDTLILSRFNEIVYEWTKRYQDILPDMTFTINGLAEPRVITANDRLDGLVHKCAPRLGHRVNGTRKALEIMDLGKESSWQIGTRSCPEDSPSRALFVPDDSEGIKFVKNATWAKDWCEHPRAAKQHGLFGSPFNLKITDTLVPVLSHGKPSTSQDILYPSPDYLDGYRSNKYDESKDGAWTDKTNKLYWSGSDTGAWVSGDQWRHFHRQRFVHLVNNKDSDISLLKLNKAHEWESYPAKMANLSHLVDVKFTNLELCDEDGCKDEREHLPFGDRDEATKIHDYRFVFDVDGMGRTERYYRLLGSRSTVLKQTMYREWHDDRLVPWVHYIPVSLGMQELPEMLRFLIETDKGQKISRDIAEAGRQWQQKALRGKDMELAFLRLLLEYGRLYGEERDTNYYCPGGREERDDAG